MAAGDMLEEEGKGEGDDAGEREALRRRQLDHTWNASARADSSVFGRATGGLEVIHSIENVRTDKNDKPHDEVRMMSITVE